MACSSKGGAEPPAAPPSPVLQRLDACLFWAVHFSLHLCIVATFESIFFFQFVAQSESAALLGLVNSYVGGTLSSCGNWSSEERQVVSAFLGLLLNRSSVDAAGAAAAAERASVNSSLSRASWAYVGSLAALFLLLTLGAWARKTRIHFRRILAENLALVALLGLYELFFFKAVIFKYQAVSVRELDSTVLDELHATCKVL